MSNQMSGASPIRLIWEEACFWGSEVFYSFLTILMTGVIAQQLGLADTALKPIKNPPYPKHAFPLFIGMVLWLYLIRYLRRVAYGLTEIWIAIIGFFFALQQNIDHFETGTFTISTAAAVYIAIRGLDNVVTGAKARYTKVGK